MNFSKYFFSVVSLVMAFSMLLGLVRCGQPLPPVGGAKDTLAPVMVKANPKDSMLNFQGNKIVLEFNEYIQLDNNLQDKLVFSPVPKIQPQLEAKLKEITIRLKDTLQANTTYAIDFGDAIKDINESNPLKNFRYVFSTGTALDNNGLSGRVLLAETGKPDSTLIVILHRNMDDSAVAKEKPRYYTRLNAKGEFNFRNIAAGTYSVFALKDAGGAFRYDSKQQLFAFLDSPVTIKGQPGSMALYAFQAAPDLPKAPTTAAPAPKDTKTSTKEQDKRLKFTTNLESNQQDILHPFSLNFERPLKDVDSTKIIFTDTTFKTALAHTFTRDSTNTKLILDYPWTENTIYKLILEKNAIADSLGNTIVKNDTVTIKTKRVTDYGSLKIRFTQFNANKHALLIFLVNNVIAQTIKVDASEIDIKLFRPAEYELRIVYDTNQNGKWDTGDYWKKLQPEKTVALPKKVNIRSNWDNEMTVQL